MKKLISFFAVLLMAGTFQPAGAGTLCGTVRDDQTALPVANAGIFVYLNNSYTGLYAATDSTGLFCIDPIAPGTYDLQVKVDEFDVTWVPNVTVDDATVSIDVERSFLDVSFSLWPNPASTQVNFHFQAPNSAPVSLEVYSVSGRLVRAWSGRGSGGEAIVSWNLTDLSGARIAPGVYLARVRAGSRVSTRKLVLAR